MKKDVLERFCSKFERRGPDECWPWTGAISQGRGVFAWTERVASRAAYELFVGPIPKGLVVRHTCDNGRCVNPAHLLLGTQRQNMQDAVDRERHPRGQAHGRAKLTEDSVREIILSEDGIEALAARYVVSPEMIGMIQRGKRWRYVVVENMPDRIRKRREFGRWGEGHWRSVITQAIADEIRSSTEKPAVIAARYGISTGNVYHIRKGETWAKPQT